MTDGLPTPGFHIRINISEKQRIFANKWLTNIENSVMINTLT